MEDLSSSFSLPLYLAQFQNLFHVSLLRKIITIDRIIMFRVDSASHIFS